MIYLLEDDDNIRNFVTYALNNSGLLAEGFDVPSAFWRAVEKEKPSMAILDIMLPEEDGLSVMRKLRNRPDTKDMPIMMLTAKGETIDKVLGLEAGADDLEAEEGIFTVYTQPDDVAAVAEALSAKYRLLSAQVEMVPQNYITLTDEGDIKNMSKMLEMFDDNEDVQNVWHNWENEE